MLRMRCKTRHTKILVLQVIVVLFLTTTSQKISTVSSSIGPTEYEGVFVWSTAVVLSSESSLRSIRPDIAIDTMDNVHVLWQDMTNFDGFGSDDDIVYRMWNATAESWSETIVLSPATDDSSSFPTIKVDDNNNIHTAWRDKSPIDGSGSDYDLFYRFWNSSTKIWQDVEVASVESTGNIYWVDIAVKNDSVYVVWQDESGHTDNLEDVLFSSRLSNGTWTPPVIISTVKAGTASNAKVAVDIDYNVHITWNADTNIAGAGTDVDVLYRIRNATTGLWSSTEVISDSSNSQSWKAIPAINSQNQLYVFWADDSAILDSGQDRDIFYRSKNLSEQSNWSNIKLLTEASSDNSEVPTVVFDSEDHLHAFWFDISNIDNSGVDQDVFYRYMNSSTAAWSDYTVISQDSTDDSWRPEAAVDSNNILHVVWIDRTVNYAGSGSDIDIFYSQGPIPKATPNLTITDQPAEEVYVEKGSVAELSWTVSDRNVSNPTYTIERDGNDIESGAWTTDIPITHDLSEYAIGNYSFTLQAFDGWGEVVSSKVVVFITPKTREWAEPLVLGFIGIGVAVVPVSATTAIIILLRRSKAQ